MDGCIIDTRASDHMTGSLTMFSCYKKCVDNMIVSVADGSTSLVVGIGDVVYSEFYLKNVLHVPSLKYNLLSLSKLTKDLNCAVTFACDHCAF